MKNDDMSRDQAQKQLAEVNKEIRKINNEIQELQLKKNSTLLIYQARKAELNKSALGKIWDFVRGKRGNIKRAVEESHQELHDLEAMLQRNNEKLLKLNFEATELAQKANKEMFEDVVNSGTETIKDIREVHQRINKLQKTIDSQIENINLSFSATFMGVVENLRSTNERLNDVLDKSKNDSKEVDQIADEILSKTKELEEIITKNEKKIDELILQTDQKLNHHTNLFNSVGRKIDDQASKTENELNESKLQIKFATNNIQRLESSFQSKTNEFDSVLNKQDGKLNQVNKKIEDYSDDFNRKVDATNSSLQDTNANVKTVQSTFKEGIEFINAQLSSIEVKFNTQLEQNRMFEELLEEQKVKARKLKNAIIIGTVIGSLGLLGSILSFIL